jgi:hypothetical protein
LGIYREQLSNVVGASVIVTIVCMVLLVTPIGHNDTFSIVLLGSCILGFGAVVVFGMRKLSKLGK